MIVKPNAGGSGAGIPRFLTAEDLAAALTAEEIESAPGDVLLLQKYHPARDGSIVRIETLDTRFLNRATARCPPRRRTGRSANRFRGKQRSG